VICWTQVLHLGRESLRAYRLSRARYRTTYICLLNLSERGLTDDKLSYLMSNAPERSFTLLEEVVDAAFNKRVQTSEDR